MQGKGNTDAARHYDAATEAFVATGQVTAAVCDAAPQSTADVQALRAAEAANLVKAKSWDLRLEF